jgi:hypothetical protein
MLYFRNTVAATAFVAITFTCLGISLAKAQAPATAVSTPKQDAKAQRKADRKAARVRKNAELGALEKNGYNPVSSQANYPENLQDAEKKAAAPKGASAAK